MDLVLEGLYLRFSDCVAGIWISGWNDGWRTLSLVTSINLPSGFVCSAKIERERESSADDQKLLDDITPQIQQLFREHGIQTANCLPIRNTKGKVAGLIAISSSQSCSLSDMELQLVQRYTQVVGLAIEKEQLDRDNYILAYYDYLTMVPNRRLFHQRLANAIQDSLKLQSSFSLVLLDLDNFKGINDNFGHSAGDRVLEVVARRITQMLTEDDTFARLGGDEFGLILTRSVGNQALGLINEVIESIGQPIPWGESYVSVFASAGIVSCPEHGTNEDELLRYADASLYEAKNSTYIHAKLHLTSMMDG